MVELKFILCVSLALSLTIHRANFVSGDSSDQDEGSCICGLNKSILDQLERIVRESTKTTCQVVPVDSSDSHTNASDHSDNPSDHSKPSESSPNNQNESSNFGWPGQKPKEDSESNNESTKNDSINADKNEEKPEMKPNSWDLIEKLTDEIHHLEGLINKPSSSATLTGDTTLTSPSIAGSGSSSLSNQPASMQNQEETNNQRPVPSNDNKPVNAGFLGGVEVSPMGDNASNKPLLKPDNLASVIESTVPNVVSNIFSNIQNLTLSPELGMSSKPSAQDNPSVLTSINGQTVNIQGDTSVEITAEGERLFLAWIEQQIARLHLTASMAKYIRNSAVNLFKKIVKQYVERVEKLGGSIEANVRKATQLALTNTETLIKFLLKNYLYVSAGIMRLIGEQVSQIGKQLDQTGETITHLTLNPFDIMSKVMESLPNPSDYSMYFRNLGKQLLNELTWTSNDSSENLQSSQQNSESLPETNDDKQQSNMNGLFKKTMGALSKTLSSWIG